ncbi:MAG: HAMP domain-containing sensor histidine kinase, partial [Bacilli bacterium]
MKRVLGRFINRLSVRLFLLLLLGLLLSWISMSIVALFVNHYVWDLIREEPMQGIFWYNSAVVAMFISLIFSFFGTILLGMQYRLRYISEITNDIQRIALVDNIHTIPVRGKDELAVLATSINHMQQRLEENRVREKAIEQEKNDMIVAVSHDLRTPLTSVMGYLTLLQTENLTETQRAHYISLASEKSQQLHNHLEALFQYAKVTSVAYALHVQPILFDVYTKQLLGTYIPLWEEAGFKVDIDVAGSDWAVSIDPNQLGRVFDNLFSNVLKYATPGTKIEAKVASTQTDVVFCCTNETTTVSPAEAERLFERMYRRDESRRSERGGSGLGLAIARMIAE